MKHIAYVLAAAAVVAAGMIATTPSAFADHPNVVLEPLPGSATAGCEQTDEGCYNMPILTVAPGTTITFSNTDNAAHTLTAGSPADGPSGAFDSGLVMVGATYEFTLEEEGTYDHYCLVHPWRTGQIIVEATHGDDDAMMGDTAPADGILVYANGTHVTIDWQDAEHATRYLVQIYTGTLLADSLFVTDSILANKELRPGVLYTITATPYVDSRAGVERELAKVRVNDITDPPVPPTVRVNDITDPPVPPTPPPPFNGTISIGSETSAIEAVKLKIAELEAAIATLNSTLTGLLERIEAAQMYELMPPPESIYRHYTESQMEQMSIRLLNTSGVAYDKDDRIHFEGTAPPCSEEVHDSNEIYMTYNYTTIYNGTLHQHGEDWEEMFVYYCDTDTWSPDQEFYEVNGNATHFNGSIILEEIWEDTWGYYPQHYDDEIVDMHGDVKLRFMVTVERYPYSSTDIYDTAVFTLVNSTAN